VEYRAALRRDEGSGQRQAEALRAIHAFRPGQLPSDHRRSGRRLSRTARGGLETLTRLSIAAIRKPYVRAEGGHGGGRERCAVGGGRHACVGSISVAGTGGGSWSISALLHRTQ